MEVMENIKEIDKPQEIDIKEEAQIVGLPFSLDKFQDDTGLSVLESAQLFTVSLLDWMEKNESLDIKDDFISWLRDFEPKTIKDHVRAYEKSLAAANNIIPYIKNDIQKLLKQTKFGYSGKNRNSSHDSIEADSFVEDDIDQMYTFKCQECKSTDCTDIDFQIDHSTSVDSLSKLFTFLSEKYITTESKMLILDSGIGSLVYGAFLFSKVHSIDSCTSNTQLGEVQKEIVQRYGMSKKVSVYDSDIPTNVESIKNFDIVIVARNNRLGQSFWNDLKNNMTTGALLITIRELKYMFPSQVIPPDLVNWIKPDCQLGEINSGLEYYCIYKVQ